jgi:ribA/ribD-fused uncharacterized protein
MIRQFTNAYRFLSNFAPAEIVYGGATYSCVENAYQSAKNSDPKWKEYCQTHNPFEVKAKSKNQPVDADWDAKKYQIMRELLIQKFNDPKYRKLLIATKGRPIYEGNNWGDHYWGVDVVTLKGQNNLGKLLMLIRDSIIKEGK